MEARGLTGRLLAHALGVGETAISRWRRDAYPNGPPAPAIRRTLEYWLDLPAGWLDQPRAAEATLPPVRTNRLNSFEAWLSGREGTWTWGTPAEAPAGAEGGLSGPMQELELISQTAHTLGRLLARDEMTGYEKDRLQKALEAVKDVWPHAIVERLERLQRILTDPEYARERGRLILADERRLAAGRPGRPPVRGKARRRGT